MDEFNVQNRILQLEKELEELKKTDGTDEILLLIEKAQQAYNTTFELVNLNQKQIKILQEHYKDMADKLVELYHIVTMIKGNPDGKLQS